MGDIQSKRGDDERPVREVTIQRSFAMGRYEVTFDQYDEFVKATGRKLPDDEGLGRGSQPVIRVSWNDAVAYAAWLSGQAGKRYRLPTEAEWEYAARAGTETTYWWGNDIKQGLANCRTCGSKWDGKSTAPVGSFKPNAFGLSIRLAMYRSGCRIAGMRTIRERRRMDRLGKKKMAATAACAEFAAACGSGHTTMCVRPSGSGTVLASAAALSDFVSSERLNKGRGGAIE
jgi:hypothetical protein